jgi:hypothetical protein
VTAPVLDLLCPLCFVLYASAAVQRGARCGAVSDKVPDGCSGKLIETEPRTAKPRRLSRGDRKTAGAAVADEPAEATSR